MIFSKTWDILRWHSCCRLGKWLELAQFLNLQVASRWEGMEVYYKAESVFKIILTH